MQSLLPIAVSAFFIVAANNAHAAAPLTISSQDWTITADQEHGVLSISQHDLGIVLKDVRMNVGDQSAVVPLTGWSAEQTNPSQLTIHTVHPITAWNFDLSHNMLKISSTATNGVLTAEAPAPSNRIPCARAGSAGIPRRLDRDR